MVLLFKLLVVIISQFFFSEPTASFKYLSEIFITDNLLQEDFLSRLPPDLAQQCRNVFSNTTARVFNVTKEKPSLLAQSGLLDS